LEWKVNFDFTNILEDIEIISQYKLWCNEINKCFSGLNTFEIDWIIAKYGKEYILEVNGSSHGLLPEHFDGYLSQMRDLILIKLNKKLNQMKIKCFKRVKKTLKLSIFRTKLNQFSLI
jgi:hypothetical protein